MDISDNLCMGCMNKINGDDDCPYCGYSDSIPYLQQYLKPKTILNNRYIVGKVLSYNGEGASYIGYDTVSDQKCVIREYMPSSLCKRDSKTNELKPTSSKQAMYKTLMSEFADMNRSLSRMRNLQHIVTAKDMFSENGTTYVVFEYVEGISLKKFLQTNDGFLTWEQVKKSFMPLFTTLSIIHNAGIIHRGISPENIIVSSSGDLKLTGFCISSIRTSNTGLVPEFYSGYSAPEQYSSLEWQGTWTDVYALAAVIYRILTGIVPLDAQTRLNNDTMPDAGKINQKIPPRISRILKKAMAVRGEERIRTVTDLVSALFKQNSVHMEHSKGATQTIPIAHVPKNRKPEETQVKSKPMDKKTAVIGWSVLGVFLVLSIILLVQLFSGPADNEDYDIQTSSAVPLEDDSQDDIVYSQAETTAVTSSKSKYGEGSIMPNVVGIAFETVQKELGGDFKIKVEYYYSDTDEKGVIVKQSIPEGTEYDPKAKHTLKLKVCSGPAKVEVPSFEGYKQKDYLSLLNSLNIKYKVVTAKSTEYEKDFVAKTSIAVGDMINVKDGQVLTVTVSSGLVEATTTTAVTSDVQTQSSVWSQSETQAPDNNWQQNEWNNTQQQ